MTSIRFLAFLSALTAVPALAQSPAAGSPGPKRPLTQADWDRWRSITGAVMSRDGRWAAYTLVPLVGDGELVVRATRGETEYRVPRGYLGRPNNVPGGLRPAAGANPEAAPVGPTASPAQFSADSRFVVVTVQPSQAEVVRTERGGGGRPAPRTRNSLAVLTLADGKVTIIPDVRSFRLPRDNGTWLAYVPEPDTTADTTRSEGQAARRPHDGPTGPPFCSGIWKPGSPSGSTMCWRTRSTTAPRCSPTPWSPAIPPPTARSSGT